MILNRLCLCLVIMTVLLLLAACSSSSSKPLMENSAFLCDKDLHTDNPIAQLDLTAKTSDFLPLHENKVAYEWRLALVDQAKETLDVQTFIWEDDEAGALLTDRIIKAANRGVKVRLLVDDFLLAGRDNIGVLINSHPNIELRVFNPMEVRESRWAFRGFEVLFNLARLNQRMHNKLFIADNKAGIIGGRNIGNEYFGLGHKLNYRDFDLVTRGPIVEDITHSFNVFWNSPYSLPLHEIANNRTLKSIHSEEAQNKARQVLNEQIDDSKALKQAFDTEVQDWREMFEQAAEHVVSGRSRVIYDCPPSADDPAPVHVAELLRKIVLTAEKEVFFISPYLIPSKGFRDDLKVLNERGVRVRILTNSLESSDSAAAVSGYAKYRKDLLELGVEIYELRGDAAFTNRFKAELSEADFLSFHAKVIIFDQSAVYVGSLNLDPRSRELNTEIGVLIENETLAKTLTKDFEVDLLIKNSWAVSLNEGNDVVWRSTDEELTSTPSRNFWQRMSMFFYSLMPIESQL